MNSEEKSRSNVQAQRTSELVQTARGSSSYKAKIKMMIKKTRIAMAAVILAVTTFSLPLRADIPALKVQPTNSYAGYVTGMGGWGFRAVGNVIVMALGTFGATLSVPHQAVLWECDSAECKAGTIVAQTTVFPSDPVQADFHFHAIPRLTLQDGHHYIVTSSLQGDAAAWWGSYSVDRRIVYEGNRYKIEPGTPFPSGCDWSCDAAYAGYFGGNLLLADSIGVPALTGQPTHFYGGWVTGMGGWRFRAVGNVIVTALGAFGPSLSVPHQAVLWECVTSDCMAGSIIAQTTVYPNDPIQADFHFHAISPLTLKDGHHYIVVASLQGDTGAWWGNYSVDRRIVYEGNRYKIEPGTPFPISCDWTCDASYAGYYGGDLLLTDPDQAPPAEPVATPTLSPAGGSFLGTTNVSIVTPTTGAELHYTLDGLDPTETSPLYSSPLLLTSTTTVKAQAFKSGMTPSAVATGTFSQLNPPCALPLPTGISVRHALIRGPANIDMGTSVNVGAPFFDEDAFATKVEFVWLQDSNGAVLSRDLVARTPGAASAGNGLTIGAVSAQAGDFSVLTCYRTATGAISRFDTTSFTVQPGPQTVNIAVRIGNSASGTHRVTSDGGIYCVYNGSKFDSGICEYSAGVGGSLHLTAYTVGGKYGYWTWDSGNPGCTSSDPLKGLCTIDPIRNGTTVIANFD